MRPQNPRELLYFTVEANLVLNFIVRETKSSCSIYVLVFYLCKLLVQIRLRVIFFNLCAGKDLANVAQLAHCELQTFHRMGPQFVLLAPHWSEPSRAVASLVIGVTLSLSIKAPDLSFFY